MSINPASKSIKYIANILFIIGTTSLLFSQEPRQGIVANRGYIESHDIPENKKGTAILREGAGAEFFSQGKEGNLSELQKQSRLYRSEGLELQGMGNLEGAMSFYQKAIELDPSYAVTYNDLGIIYETEGDIERAEASYLKSIQINPNYLSAYSNLALLYENKRDLDKASFYWKKRAELGAPHDPWTQKANQRFKDIQMVQPGIPFGSGEQEVIDLTKDVLNQKTRTLQDNREPANVHFQKAKLSYQKQDEVTALKEAIDAQLLDPSNREIEEFIEKVQNRLLSK